MLQENNKVYFLVIPTREPTTTPAERPAVDLMVKILKKSLEFIENNVKCRQCLSLV